VTEEAHKLQVKLFAGSADASLETFIPIFHDWIKHHRLPELLIDVANYAHVPRGPGVALIGHQGDYYIDEADGRRGILYSRKREPPPPAERVADAFRRALNAAVLLEKEPAAAGLRFGTGELLFRINDRLLAPPGDATYAAVRPALEAVGKRLWSSFELAPVGGPKDLFTVRISGSATADAATLLDRLGGPPSAA
jgi:hypothetical protein